MAKKYTVVEIRYRKVVEETTEDFRGLDKKYDTSGLAGKLGNTLKLALGALGYDSKKMDNLYEKGPAAVKKHLKDNEKVVINVIKDAAKAGNVAYKQIGQLYKALDKAEKAYEKAQKGQKNAEKAKKTAQKQVGGLKKKVKTLEARVKKKGGEKSTGSDLDFIVKTAQDFTMDPVPMPAKEVVDRLDAP